MEHSEHHSRLAGKIGLLLSTLLWGLTSWRLIFHLCCRRRESTAESEPERRRLFPPTQCSPTRWFTRRRTFHFLLWLSQGIEIVAYVDISGLIPLSRDRVFAEKLGYILLDVTGRSVLELLSFATITALWIKTAIRSGPAEHNNLKYRLFPALFLIFTMMLVIASVSLSIVAFSDFRTDSLATIQNSQLSRGQVLLEAFAWGLHSLVVLQCLLLTWNRVTTVVEPSRDRRKLLCKAVLPMMVTSLAYAFRCAWLLSLFYHTPGIERGTWYWWICFEWLPTWVAVSMLLYSARKRDQVTSSSDLQEPLLRPQPPAEAFLAFSRHRNGEEVDDSFTLNSPILQVNVSSDEEEVADEETLSIDSFSRGEADLPQPG